MFCGLNEQLVLAAWNLPYANMLVADLYDLQLWGPCPHVEIDAELIPVGNFAARLGPVLGGGSVNFHAGSHPD